MRHIILCVYTLPPPPSHPPPVVVQCVCAPALIHQLFNINPAAKCVIFILLPFPPQIPLYLQCTVFNFSLPYIFCLIQLIYKIVRLFLLLLCLTSRPLSLPPPPTYVYFMSPVPYPTPPYPPTPTPFVTRKFCLAPPIPT